MKKLFVLLLVILISTGGKAQEIKKIRARNNDGVKTILIKAEITEVSYLKIKSFYINNELPSPGSNYKIVIFNKKKKIVYQGELVNSSAGTFFSLTFVNCDFNIWDLDIYIMKKTGPEKFWGINPFPKLTI